MEEKKVVYAPIIIGTLNRVEHLKRCINSLQQNEWAKYTELYISIDYPAKESHWEGYKKVKKYLGSGIEGFKKTIIFNQSMNLGSRDNYMFLLEKVFEFYDRCIVTEDDNEFSPCFIEFMDKGLELFKEDPDIIYLCGYVPEKEWYTEGENILKLSSIQYYYGTAFWKEKWMGLIKKENKAFFDSIGRNPFYIWKLYYHSRNMLWWYVHRYLCDPFEAMVDGDGEPQPIDINHNIYFIIKNKYIITPVKSLSRNYGRDGSGENCGVDSRYNPFDIVIDDSQHFEYRLPVPFKMRKENRKIQAGIDGSLKLRDNVKVLQNWILREILGDKGYHGLLRLQDKYKEKKSLRT